jgi:hypothetical protein
MKLKAAENCNFQNVADPCCVGNQSLFALRIVWKWQILCAVRLQIFRKLKLRCNGLLYLTYFFSFCISVCLSRTCFLYLGRTRFASHREDRHRKVFLCIFDNIFGLLVVTPCSLEHTYIQTYIQTYIHTHIQTYIHTYIHSYIHPIQKYIIFPIFVTLLSWNIKSTCFSLPSLFI